MNNVERIRRAMLEKNLDALLLTDEKNQRYATGFHISDGAVLVTKKRAALITDSRYIEAAENTVDPEVTPILYSRENPLMKRILEVLHEDGAERVGAEEGKLSHGQYLAYEKRLGLTLLPAQELLVQLRASKTGDEIQRMIHAQRISEAALEEVLPMLRPGMTEREAAAELVYHMLKNGSEGNSFDPIVVTGKNTSLPHGVPGDSVICEGDFVTMDFGCLYDGYCSDMTRTVAIGYATDEMRNVYETVLKAQLAGIAAARAGVSGKSIDGAARQVIADAGYGQYFGHGFGHCLGLDIHEPPTANPSGETIMPVNAVSSAEPGIYLPGKFGVRIEDVMILREEGAEVITRAPKKDLLILQPK